MKILIAPDKFKYTFSAQQVANAVEAVIKTQYTQIETVKLPLADGGEGTSEILAVFVNAKPVTLKVHNPIFKLIDASYYYSEKNKIAIIDMSAASGLHLLKPEDQNPMHTSTYGTGELICHAVEKGAKTIYLALGGSATNDAGCGAAEALGFQFCDKTGKLIRNITGKNLIEISKIDTENVKINFDNLNFISLYDVKNNLHGENGASYIYAGQKGANPKEIKLLDDGLRNFATGVHKQFNIDLNNCYGYGAAGGFGAGSKVFFNSELKSGAETMIQLSGFNKLIKDIDLIITGEGKFDAQSFEGKLTGTIINKAEKNNIPVAVICGLSDIKSQNSYYKIYPLFNKFPGTDNIKQLSLKRIEEIIPAIIKQA